MRESIYSFFSVGHDFLPHVQGSISPALLAAFFRLCDSLHCLQSSLLFVLLEFFILKCLRSAVHVFVLQFVLLGILVIAYGGCFAGLAVCEDLCFPRSVYIAFQPFFALLKSFLTCCCLFGWMLVASKKQGFLSSWVKTELLLIHCIGCLGCSLSTYGPFLRTSLCLKMVF